MTADMKDSIATLLRDNASLPRMRADTLADVILGLVLADLEEQKPSSLDHIPRYTLKIDSSLRDGAAMVPDPLGAYVERLDVRRLQSMPDHDPRKITALACRLKGSECDCTPAMESSCGNYNASKRDSEQPTTEICPNCFFVFRPNSIDGRALYDIYVSGMARRNIEVDSFEMLDAAEQAAWEGIAEQLKTGKEAL